MGPAARAPYAALVKQVLSYSMRPAARTNDHGERHCLLGGWWYVALQRGTALLSAAAGV